MADPTREHTTYTWDPVTAAWVHERGPEVPPPPLPPDVHALQSYFFDVESKEWIRTVLAPMGRELAARYQGAHKIPEDRAHAAKGKGAQAKKGSSAFGIVVIVVVLVVLLGGAGVVASQSGMLPAGTTPKPTAAVDTSPAAPTVAASVPTSAAPTDAAAATPPPVTPTAPVVVPTRAPTLPPVVNLPAGPRATLPDGTIVVYTGATTATRGGFLPTGFTVVSANGRAASGELTIVLGDLAKDPRLVSGLLDTNGKIALDMPATLAVGQYPLSIVFKGSRAFLATITLK